MNGFEHWWRQAVENYLIGIVESSLSKSFDLRISRLISLWFDNRANSELTRLLQKWLPKIPSCHFIPVLPQLAARLTLPNRSPHLFHEDFPQLLLGLMEKCAMEHPHHTLSVILALVLTNKDKEYTASVKGNWPLVSQREMMTSIDNGKQQLCCFHCHIYLFNGSIKCQY